MGVVTAAAVVGAGASLYGAYSSYEAGKAQEQYANQQYAESQATFSNEVEAAITNAEWKKDDTINQYYFTKDAQTQLLNNTINNAYDVLTSNTDYMNAKTNLDNLLKADLTNQELEKIKDSTLANIKMSASMAQLDADYAMAMGKSAANYASTKAAIDSQEIADVAQYTLQFLDQDINSMKTELNRMREEAQVADAQAIGASLIKGANQVAVGASRAREIINTAIKADRLLNATEAKQETALNKAYAMSNKTSKEAGSRIQGNINTGIAQSTKAMKDAIASASRVLNSSKVSQENMKEMFKLSSNYIVDSTQAQLNYASTLNSMQVGKAVTDTAQQIANLTDNYNTEMQNLKDTTDYSVFTSNRGIHESWKTWTTTESRGDPEMLNRMNTFYDENGDTFDRTEITSKLQKETI